jgi:hypothetical protein
MSMIASPACHRPASAAALVRNVPSRMRTRNSTAAVGPSTGSTDSTTPHTVQRAFVGIVSLSATMAGATAAMRTATIPGGRHPKGVCAMAMPEIAVVAMKAIAAAQRVRTPPVRSQKDLEGVLFMGASYVHASHGSVRCRTEQGRRA